MSSPRTFAAIPVSSLVTWLTLLATPLGAALAFLLQPMMGKLLLPRLGGTAAVWLGASLFFQISLLLGYAWGIWLARRCVRTQLISQGSLALLAIVSFHAPDGFDGSPTIPGVMLALSAACLPAMVLLFSLSPWIHAWRERLGMAEPYAIYALSSIGSLLALVLYPFAIEPLLGLSDQLTIWHTLLFLLATVITAGLAGLWFAARTNPALDLRLDTKGEGITPLSWIIWISLGALSCITMLGAIQLVSDEIGAIPLAWIGPLGVYLAAFALVFSGRWQPWMTGSCIVGLGLSLAGYMTYKGFGAATIDGIRLLFVVLTCGFASLVGVALLHAARPNRGGEWFYLCLAAGGALGGMAALWVVPMIFPRPIEFPFCAALLLAAGLFWGARWRHPGAAAACVALTLGPIFILGSTQAEHDRMGDGVLTHYRDIYGHLMVKTDARSVVISSATTTHGSQITEPLEARARPTKYFTESSAVGRTIHRLQTEKPSLRIAVVGLGAGTLASYLRPDDEMVFYDIDPKIESVARRHFTYLKDSKGKITVELGDGRRRLAETGTDFDLIVIDAFMGDSIPMHLLTQEAMQVYQKRLHVRNGLVLVNSTLRYSDIFPFVASTARTVNWESVGVRTDIESALAASDWDAVRSTYAVIGSPERVRIAETWMPVEEDGGRVQRTITRATALLAGPRDIWTDDRSASMDTLDLSRWLSP